MDMHGPKALANDCIRCVETARSVCLDVKTRRRFQGPVAARLLKSNYIYTYIYIYIYRCSEPVFCQPLADFGQRWHDLGLPNAAKLQQEVTKTQFHTLPSGTEAGQQEAVVAASAFLSRNKRSVQRANDEGMAAEQNEPATPNVRCSAWKPRPRRATQPQDVMCCPTAFDWPQLRDRTSGGRNLQHQQEAAELWSWDEYSHAVMSRWSNCHNTLCRSTFCSWGQPYPVLSHLEKQ